MVIPKNGNLFRVLQSRSKIFYLVLIVLGVCRSLTGIGILMLITRSLSGKSERILNTPNYLIYACLIIFSFVFTGLFQNYMVKLTNDIMFEMELTIIQKVRNSTKESFEKVGYSKVFAAINDSRMLGNVPEVIVNYLNSLITVFCSLGYLFWSSIWGALTVLFLMVVLFCLYIYRDGKIKKDLNEARDLQDMHYRYLQELFSGFKQIRISAVKNKNLFVKYLLPNRTKSKVLGVKTARKYLVNELIGVYSWYLVLGIIMFPLPFYFKMDIGQIATFITAVLLMIAPISHIVLFSPTYNSFKIAIERIAKINTELDEVLQSTGSASVAVEDIASIQFKDVVFKYSEKTDSKFTVKIDDLEIKKGEIIFVVGDNGSGKSTFINILLGLSMPHQGSVQVNGKEYSWKEYAGFSNCMAVVFTDHYLFLNNYEEFVLDDGDESLACNRKLTRMDGIFTINNEYQSTDNNLSKGQQKRLALLLCLMEDKPLLILDEWAAEQDPANRKYFYFEFLAEMKKRGKTVVAITHDDDYYYLADRIIRFDFGSIVAADGKAQHVESEAMNGFDVVGKG